MYLMKNLSHIVLLLIIMTGCHRNVADIGLEVTPEMIACPMEGGEFEVSVTGRHDWTTDNTAGWISVRRHDGYAVINIDRNNGTARESVIGFRANGIRHDEIRIIQENSDAFAIDRNHVFIGYKGGQTSVTLTCYDSWKAEADCDWISLDTTEGDSPAEIGITVGQTREIEEREGKVAFRCGSRTLIMTVRQALTPYVEVEKSVVEFDGDGGQSQVLYMSNTEVRITCAYDWIRLIETDGSVKKTSFEIKRNLEPEIREGEIIIASSDDEEIFKTISIRQGPKIDHPKLSFAEGETLELSDKEPIQLHPVFEDMTDLALTWQSDDHRIATVDQSGIVTILSGGTCMITAKNRFHGVEASVMLKIKPKAGSITVIFGEQVMNATPVAVRFAGEKFRIKVLMDPSDAYDDDVVYFSTDEHVAEIRGNDVNCLNPGKTDIYIESSYHSIRQVYTLVVLE